MEPQKTVLARPPEARGLLVWTYPATTFALGATLEVGPEECVALRRDGMLVTGLDSGTYSLAPEHVPAVGLLLEADGTLRSDLLFVWLGEIGWLEGKASKLTLDPVVDFPLEVGVAVRFSVRVTDPRRAIEIDYDDPRWLLDRVAAAAWASVAASIKHRGLIATMRADAWDELAEAMNGRLATLEQETGLALERLGDLRIEVEQEALAKIEELHALSDVPRREEGARTRVAALYPAGSAVRVMWEDDIAYRAIVVDCFGPQLEVEWAEAGGRARVLLTQVADEHLFERSRPPEEGDAGEAWRPDGSFAPILVLAVDAERVEVRWEEDRRSEWIDASRLREPTARRATRTTVGEAPQKRDAGPTRVTRLGARVDEAPTAVTTYPAATRVVMREDEASRPATVVLNAGDRILVSYDDRRERAWVGPEAIEGLRDLAKESSQATVVRPVTSSEPTHDQETRVAPDPFGSGVLVSGDPSRPPNERSGRYRVGDVVWARAFDARWYRAHVRQKYGDTHLIEWEDGCTDPERKSATELRPIGPQDDA